MNIDIRNKAERKTGEPSHGAATGSGVCARCESTVALDARRCGSCGYEPSDKRSVSVIAGCALVALLGALTMFAAAATGGLPLLNVEVASSTAKTLGLPTILVSTPLLYGYLVQDRRTPADPTIL